MSMNGSVSLPTTLPTQLRVMYETSSLDRMINGEKKLF